MVFSDTTTSQGLYQDAQFLVSQNSTSFRIEDFTRMANKAMDEITSIILGADGTWQWDDTNQTDLPIGTTNLVSAQTDYSYDNDYIVITQMDCKDPSGNWIKLKPIDEGSYDQPLDEVFGSGTPEYYDKKGSSIFLYPTPNYNSTNGLRAHFQRKGSYFSTTDTTKEPGIAGHLHKYVSIFAAHEYALTKGLPQIERLRLMLDGIKKDISDFYSYRERDIKNTLSVMPQNNR